MKKAAVIGFMMICTSSSAMAYGYSYDYVDENANREVESKRLALPPILNFHPVI